MWFTNDQLIVCCDETNEDETVFRRAARKAGVASEIRFFTDAKSARAFFISAAGEPEELPDLVFLRYRMPDGSGKELLETIRSTPGLEHVPVVFMTAPGGDEMFMESPPPGATMVYEKLITPETFTEVEELLESNF